MRDRLLRYGVQDDGRRYVARERRRNSHGLDRCEHATWVNGRVIWKGHEEGGTMLPFTGPDDVYARITAGGLEAWKPTTP